MEVPVPDVQITGPGVAITLNRTYVFNRSADILSALRVVITITLLPGTEPPPTTTVQSGRGRPRAGP